GQRLLICCSVGGEKRLQAVIVGVQDGIVLVVVAAGTAYRQPKENQPCGIRHVVEVFLAMQLNVLGVVLGGVMAVESRCHQGGLIVRKQLVARQLLQNE